VDEFEHISLDGSKPRNASRGQVLKGQTEITFRKAAGSQTNIIIQGARGPQRNDSLFRSDFNFEQMGIGGLDEQFKKMFRTAFASRIFPGIVKQLGALFLIHQHDNMV
jgi:vesicle-fusing ATPase